MSRGHRCVGGALAASAVAALVWAGLAQAGTPSCNSALPRIEAGAAGPLKCVSAGTPTILVGRSTTLALKTISVALTGVRKASRYTSVVRGQAPDTVKPQGVFLVLTATLTNHTRASAVFKTGDQVALEIGDNTYFATEFVDSHLGFDALLSGPTIHPGKSVAGDLLFDVPKSAVRTFPSKSGLAFVNFGQSTDSGPVSQVGVIVLAGGR